MESKYRNIRNQNRWMVGGTRDTDSITREITDIIGTIVVFAMMGLLAIVFMAVTGCGGVATKMNTITSHDGNLSTVRVVDEGGEMTERIINEPFEYEGKTAIVTTAKSVDMMMAINIARMDARKVIGRNRVIEQQIVKHQNGIQYVVLMTSQKI